MSMGKMGLLGALSGLGEGLSIYGKSMFDDAIEEKRQARLQAIRDKEYARNRADQVADRDARIAATKESAQMQIEAANARQAELLDARASEGALDRQSSADIANASNATRLAIASLKDPSDLMGNVKILADAKGNERAVFIDPNSRQQFPILLGEALNSENTNGASNNQNEWNKKPGRARMPTDSALRDLAEDPSDENLEAFFRFYKYIPSQYSYTPEKYR